MRNEKRRNKKHSPSSSSKIRNRVLAVPVIDKKPTVETAHKITPVFYLPSPRKMLWYSLLPFTPSLWFVASPHHHVSYLAGVIITWQALSPAWMRIFSPLRSEGIRRGSRELIIIQGTIPGNLPASAPSSFVLRFQRPGGSSSFLAYVRVPLCSGSLLPDSLAVCAFNRLLPCKLEVWEWVVKRRIFNQFSEFSGSGWV